MSVAGTSKRRSIGRTALILAGASAVVGLMTIASLGVRIGGDSTRYLNGAAALLAGHGLDGKYASYSGYSALVALAQLATGDARAVVVFHMVCAAAAAVATWDMARRLADELAGTLAALAFILNADIARWHAYLLTDSVYISSVILMCWITWRAAERGRWWVIAAGVLALFAALVRPNGWILLPIWIAFLTCQRLRTRMAAKLLVVIATALAFVTVAAASKPFRAGIEFEYPGRWLREGVVVWGYQGWRVNMPPDAAPVTGDWRKDIGYAFRHPVASARLAMTRVAAEVAHVRPFYSSKHNALIVAGLLVVYPLFALGAWRWRRHALTQLALAIIVAHLLIVALTFADWDGRFLLYVFPLVTLFAGSEAAVRLSTRFLPRSSV